MSEAHRSDGISCIIIQINFKTNTITHPPWQWDNSITSDNNDLICLCVVRAKLRGAEPPHSGRHGLAGRVGELQQQLHLQPQQDGEGLWPEDQLPPKGELRPEAEDLPAGGEAEREGQD